MILVHENRGREGFPTYINPRHILMIHPKTLPDGKVGTGSYVFLMGDDDALSVLESPTDIADAINGADDEVDGKHPA